MSLESGSEALGEERPGLLTIDDEVYDIDAIPDEIKILINDLIRVNQELAEHQFRLRHAQAAQQTYIATIKSELKRLKVKPREVSTPASD